MKGGSDDTWSDLAKEEQTDFVMPADPGVAGNYTATFTYTKNVKKPTVTLTKQS